MNIFTRIVKLFSFVSVLICPSVICAEIFKIELAGNNLTQAPYFEYVKAFNSNTGIAIAIDPVKYPALSFADCYAHITEAKTAAQWASDPTITDITDGGALYLHLTGGTIQNNIYTITAPGGLNSDAGTGLGVGYDVVLDCDTNNMLSDGDYIDGYSDEAGFYVVHDTASAGPLSVVTESYSIDPVVATSFGIPPGFLSEKVFYPSNISTLGQLPVIITSHGVSGFNENGFDYIGMHMASYGYIVMSHANDVGPGVQAAATTTLGHTDAFIDQSESGAIAGGLLAGHIDTDKIMWIGHSRGAEGVVIAYDRLFDGTHTPVSFTKESIKLVSSMAPTDFSGTDYSNPHDVNYHLFTASGDNDVYGGAGWMSGDLPDDRLQTFHLHDRATHFRQSTVIQGTGHDLLVNGWEGTEEVDGPCSIGPTNDLTHLIVRGYLLPLAKYYLEDNIPALDFLTRQYERFRPISVPYSNPCIVVNNEFRNGSTSGNFIIDDYQSQTNTGISSSGGPVTFDVENLVEGRLDDNDISFNWTPTDPFNGSTQAGSSTVLTIFNDNSRGVVFDWTNEDKFYEWEIIPAQRNFSDNLYLSFRGAQATHHPNTIAELGDLSFTVTLRDSSGETSSINIGSYGGGLEEPYQRYGGWHNEMETIRIRLTDFTTINHDLNLNDIVAVRFKFGPSWGSDEGRVVLDELMLTNDTPPNATHAPVLRLSETILNYYNVELGFAFTKAIVIHNDGNADLQVTVEVSTPPDDPFITQWSELNETSATVTIAPDAPPLILRQVYEPTELGSHTIQMVVNSNDPSTPVQPVTLTGIAVSPVPIDAMLVLDRSGSMQQAAGDRIKIQAMRDAAMLFTDLLRVDIPGPATGDKLGLWKYNHTNSEYLNLDFITDIRKTEIENSLLSDSALSDSSMLRPSGATGIGGALQNAAAVLGGPVSDRKQAMIVLTDGIENVAPYISNVLGPIESTNPDLQIYSIGLGSNIEAGKLQSITNMGNEGYHQITDDLIGESLFDLENFYFKIFANTTGMDLVVDPTHIVNLNTMSPQIVDSARIISSDKSAKFLILDDPALRKYYKLDLLTPSGDIVAEDNNIEGISVKISSKQTYKIYHVKFQIGHDSTKHLGDWLLRATPLDAWKKRNTDNSILASRIAHSSFINPKRGLVPIGFTAAVSSNYKLIVNNSARDYLPGNEILLEAALSDRGWPAGKAKVKATVTTPDKKKHTIKLYDDGTHGDFEAKDGLWANRFTQTNIPGSYKLLYQSSGYNVKGERTERESTRYVTLRQIEPTSDNKECISCTTIRVLIVFVFILLFIIVYLVKGRQN